MQKKVRMKMTKWWQKGKKIHTQKILYAVIYVIWMRLIFDDSKWFWAFWFPVHQIIKNIKKTRDNKERNANDNDVHIRSDLLIILFLFYAMHLIPHDALFFKQLLFDDVASSTVLTIFYFFVALHAALSYF